MKTKKTLLFIIASLVSMVIFADRLESFSSDIADTVIRNACVFTSAKKPKTAEAIAIKDGKIIYVGKNKKIQPYIGQNTQVIDAGWNLVTPGFIDAHTHAA